jgi:2-succinyl-5-enolpyruvyl-6-hydroxy-3-cyclohexene-1-carboxylate synthase
MMQHQAQAARDLIEALVAGGVRDAVISPGSRNTPLVLAAQACAKLRCSVAIDERVAGFIALGMSRVSGRPPLLICTSGSALAHYLPALLEADEARVPIIVLSAARPDEMTDCGAPQALDQGHILDPAVRWFKQLPLADEQGAKAWAPAAVGALAACWGSPEGPVHLNCPFREPLWAEGLETQARRGASLVPSLPSVDLDALDGLARRLSEKRGWLVCGPMHGSAADDERLCDAVRAFAQSLGWPVFAEPASRLRGRCGANEAGYLDRLLGAGFVGQYEPEVVVQIGSGLTSKRIRQWLSSWSGDHLILDRDGLWRDPTLGAGLLVAGDEAGTLDRLSKQQLVAAPSDWLTTWRDAAQAAESSLNVEGWSEASALGRVIEHFDCMQVASSLPIRHLEGWVPRSKMPTTVLSNRGLNGIDGTLSTALGVATSSGQKTLVVIGDVAFVHDLGALAQIVAEQPDLAVLVIDNSGGGIFRRLPIAAHPSAFESCFETPPAIDLLSAARGLGLSAERVEDHEALSQVAPVWVRASGPRVLIADVGHDQDQDWRALVDQALIDWLGGLG